MQWLWSDKVCFSEWSTCRVYMKYNLVEINCQCDIKMVYVKIVFNGNDAISRV